MTGPSRGATSFAKSRPYGCLRGPRDRADREDDGLHAEDHGGSDEAEARDDQRDHQDHRGDPRGEPRSANVDLGRSASSVLVGNPMEVTLLLCWKGWLRAGHIRAAPSERARSRGCAQQLQQQQQQPATRHRSTARRLVSISSRRADTPDSLPNDIVIKPTAVPAPTAGQRPWGRRWCGTAAGRRRRR